MELTVGKNYRVTDLHGTTFVMEAISPFTLEMVPSFLVGFAGGNLPSLRINQGAMDLSQDLTITPIDAEPAPKASAQPSMDQAREAALLEMLQAIAAGIYYRGNGPSAFDPEQALLHIRTRLAAFEKGSHQ